MPGAVHRSRPVAGCPEADGPSSKQLRNTGPHTISGAAAQNADHFSHNSSFSALFNEVVCSLGALAPRVATPPAPDGGGIVLHEGPTRRRHAGQRLRVVQNPHRCRHGGRASPTRPGRSAGWREKTRPTWGFQRPLREITRPASPETPKLGCFQRAGRTFSCSHPQSGRAGRTFSRTGRSDVAALKPTAPLRPLM